MSMPTESTKRTLWPNYRSIWRWHFYAGLFCIPFVILLSLSGMVYLFATEIEAFIDRPYDRNTVSGSPKSASEQVSAAIAAVPGSRLQSYEIPEQADQAIRIVVNDGQAVRLLVHPETLEVLNQVPDGERPMKQIFRFHGELMMGDRGSNLVELAASWAIIMILTGLCLWWPRGRVRLGGVLYPRLFRGSGIFWRDIHAVTGLWISGFALVLLLTGLPWAKFWGNNFRTVRKWTGTTTVRQEWDNSSSAAKKAVPDHSASHSHGGSPSKSKEPANDGPPIDLKVLDKIVANVLPLDLAPPVVITPPGSRMFGASAIDWMAKSTTPNRPKQVDLTMDGTTGEIVKRANFEDKHVIDRIVGTGIALHEGRLFGWPNQLLGLFTALGLVLVSLSSVVMWMRRKRPGTLGAPIATSAPRFSIGLLLIFAVLAAYLPLFGASALAILILEKTILSRIPRLADWLGLNRPGQSRFAQES
jgi:uncharacterized iron-regulated membrane protein